MNKRTLMIGAAVAGLIAASQVAHVSTAQAGDDTKAEKNSCKGKHSCAGKEEGKNSCKGKAAAADDKNSCKGKAPADKNSCKGKAAAGEKNSCGAK